MGARGVAHDQEADPVAQAQEEVAVFALGMIGVVEKETVLVSEHGLTLFEGDPMLPQVAGRFPVIPDEPQVAHTCPS